MPAGVSGIQRMMKEVKTNLDSASVKLNEITQVKCLLSIVPYSRYMFI